MSGEGLSILNETRDKVRKGYGGLTIRKFQDQGYQTTRESHMDD
jgi:hypothetical protein